ncbi:MAG: hypothetical protein IJ638_03930 [Alphaproteobacteria bacterium]|nr:hypothetical protein [Alphaproteobacteria bacterium]
MDKNLEELQSFANDLNSIPEVRPSSWMRSASSQNKEEMFVSGTKKIKSKMAMMSAVSMALTSGDAKKN